nr:MAG TPA: PhnA Zinc-Ribbon [Caudoviricetes sp.]
MSKNKCSWCNAMRKASGVTYLVCPNCKEKRKKNKQERKRNSKELDKISRKLNKQSINKFKRERGN